MINNILQQFFTDKKVFTKESLNGLLTICEKLLEKVSSTKDIDNLKWFRNEILAYMMTEEYLKNEEEIKIRNERFKANDYFTWKKFYENKMSKT